MSIEIQHRKRFPTTGAEWIARLAPRGLNSNAQFVLVFLSVLGLHLALAPVFKRAAATPEPGEPQRYLTSEGATAGTTAMPSPGQRAADAGSADEPAPASLKITDSGSPATAPAATPAAGAGSMPPPTPSAAPGASPVPPAAPAAPRTDSPESPTTPPPGPAGTAASSPASGPSLSDLIGEADPAPAPPALRAVPQRPETAPPATEPKAGVRPFRTLP